MITLVMGNNRTSIVNGDDFILSILWTELSYAGPTAALREHLPDAQLEWDGYVRLLHRPKTMYPWFSTGLIDRTKRICEKYGYQVQIVDERIYPTGYDIPELGTKIDLRSYQKDALEKALRTCRGVLDMPPRCFAKGTPILLPDRSTKLVQDIQVGNWVKGYYDRTQVLEVHKGYGSLYLITFENDYDPIIVNENHILYVRVADIPLFEHSVAVKVSVKTYLKSKFKRNYYMVRGSKQLVGFSIKYVGEGQFYGFTLDYPLFYSIDMIVLHNSGKTRLACELHRRIALPTIWIAPTDRIVKQTARTFDGFFGKNYAVHIVGKKHVEAAKNYKVVVCTAATAAMLPSDFYKSRKLLIIDEFHHASASTYRKIIDKCDHVFYRYGLTGTFFRSGTDTMGMHAILANTIYKIDSLFLMKQGYLVPSHVCFVPVIAKHLYKIPKTVFYAGHGKYGIHEHEWRNTLITQAATLLYNYNRKILILVGTKKQGYLLQRNIKHIIGFGANTAKFNPVEFVSTDVARSKQSDILDAFQYTDSVKVLIGTSLLGEGVDIPNADALIYARGEKAEVSLTQNMYRTATKYGDKKSAIVVDFVDRHSAQLLGHVQERLNVYYKEPTFSVDVLDYPQQFAPWLQQRINK